MREVALAFKLRAGVTRFPLTQDSLSPFPSTYPSEGLAQIDLETRSFLQALYYVSHGVELPAEHVTGRLATVTRGASGQPFDWKLLMSDFFRVSSVKADERPPNAHVAVPYKGYWFYIDQTDQDTKSTFSLLLELSRLEVLGKPGSAPLLTLPLSGK